MKVVYVALRNPEGEYLNTDYHSAIRNGMWQKVPRLYRSRVGLRAALSGYAPDVIRKHVGVEYPEYKSGWSKEDSTKRIEFWKAVHGIPRDTYFELLESAGYEILEHEIEL